MRARAAAGILPGLLLGLLSAASGRAAEAPAIVQQPRPFGYVLGDIVTQRVLLQFQGHSFEPSAVPPAERAGLWLARRSARIVADDGGRRWLLLEYQLINAPQQLMTIGLPGLTLRSKTDSSVLSVAEWPISIAPLTPRVAFAKGGLQELRPDHAAPTLATAALWKQLEWWSGGLALTLLVWLTAWGIRNARAAAREPFARALREIGRSGEHSPQSWLALHRAFDATAGRALQLETLPALFERACHLEPLRADIERFYRESMRRFFDTDSGALSGDSPGGPLPLRALCRSLRQIEKRHER